MNRVLIFMTLMTFSLSSCQKGKFAENQKELVVDTTTPKEKKEIINQWLKDLIDIDFNFTEENFNNLKIDVKEYKVAPSLELGLKLKSLEMFNIEPQINIQSSSIEIYFESMDGNLTLYLLEDKVLYWVNYFGPGRHTFEYDFNSNLVKKFPYEIEGINGDTLNVTKTYYDPRGSEHPEYMGHIWEYGKLNIKTGEIIWSGWDS